VTTLNIPAPTYPFTALALTLIWETSKLLTLRTAIFDGQFTPSRKNFIPIDWSLNSRDGLLYMLEPEFHFLKKRLILKPGAYFHSGTFVNQTDSSFEKGLWGAYLVMDLVLYSKENTSLNAYGQYSISSPELSRLQYYTGGGLRWTNPFKWPQAHDLGLAIAHARLFGQWTLVQQEFSIDHETAVELTARIVPYPWLKVQPYFQWILRDDRGPGKPEPFIAAIRTITTF
ncbi:MAG: carbohydrate porin, partial [Owenweeksia sp.]